MMFAVSVTLRSGMIFVANFKTADAMYDFIDHIAVNNSKIANFHEIGMVRVFDNAAEAIKQMEKW